MKSSTNCSCEADNNIAAAHLVAITAELTRARTDALLQQIHRVSGKPIKMNTPLPPAIFLMGPTASGKTALAVELAKRFPLEIISVDSALVYRGMNVGTAKPDSELLRRAPHRLIDIRDPAEGYSAAEFRDDALAEMADITAQGRIPLLAGGTFLYFRALQSGLSEMPAADPAVRARLEAEAQQCGWGKMHARLAVVDPQAASRIHAMTRSGFSGHLKCMRSVAGQSATFMSKNSRMCCLTGF